MSAQLVLAGDEGRPAASFERKASLPLWGMHKGSASAPTSISLLGEHYASIDQLWNDADPKMRPVKLERADAHDDRDGVNICDVQNFEMYRNNYF